MTSTAPNANDRLAAVLRTWPPFAGAIVIAVACMVLVGWTLAIDPLKRVIPGMVAMNPMTALLFIIAGAGVLLVRYSGAARTCAIPPGIGGVLILLKYFSGWDSGLDVLLFTEEASKNVMAPTTAFNFVLIGIGTWLMSSRDPRDVTRGQIIAICAAMISLLALAGYFYGVEKLYRVAAFIAMAVHSAVNFLILASGLLCVRPRRGPMARVTSAGPGGIMLRRLFPATLAVPLLLGWLILLGHRSGFFEPAIGFTIFVLAVIVFMAAMIWRSAGLLDAEDARRAGVETQLRQAQTSLERTVEQRTGDLRSAIDGVREGLQVLGLAAADILAASGQLAASAQETASSVTETTVTVEEVRQSVQQASERAQHAAASALKAAELSAAGTGATRATTAGMERICGEMLTIGQSMLRLSDQSRAIGEIIASVDELSQQSNLLAVNAAIEAAAAGRHGKGFAVVAQEVKYLSHQSREATKQVRNILGEIQKSTSAAVLTTDQATSAVEAGTAQAARAGESILGLEASVGDAAHVAADISASSQEQLVAMNQVALAMEQIKVASVDNVGQAQRLEAAARNLDAFGKRLKELAELHKI